MTDRYICEDQFLVELNICQWFSASRYDMTTAWYVMKI